MKGALHMGTIASGKYMEIAPGVEIFCVDVGSGDPIVLIPGLTFSAEIFEAQIRHFSKTNRVVAIDPRGQGRSTKTLHGNDYKTHGQDVARIIEILELDNIVLLGWSTGNLTVWSYVQDYGTAKIKSAVLIDMSPKPLSVDSDDWVEGSIDDLCQAATMLTTQEAQRAFFADYAKQVMVQRDLSCEELFNISDISSRTPCHITHSLFTNAVMGDYRDGCKKLNDSVPTMMFIAEHWSQVALPYMNRNYPNVRTCVMGGHLMFWEYPDKFNAEVDKFIDR